MRSFERVCVRMCTLAMTTMGKSQATGEIGTIDNYGDRLMNFGSLNMTCLKLRSVAPLNFEPTVRRSLGVHPKSKRGWQIKVQTGNNNHAHLAG